MLYSAVGEKTYTCFLDPTRALPMLHIQDVVDATLRLMDEKKPSIAYPYNISSFEVSPLDWQKVIAGLGYEVRLESKVDFRDAIAASWPKKIDDHLFRKDYNWSPRYDATTSAATVMETILAEKS